MCSVLIRVTGHVQGVGFRYFVGGKARETQLVGCVRNLSDGRVECEVEGPKDVIEQFIDDLKKGPPLARVDHLEVDWGPFANRFSAFEIRI